MKRALGLTLGLALVAALPLRAEDAPHLEFAHKIHQERGYPDLAIDYLQALKNQAVPADLKAVLPLEIVRIRLDVATRETNPGKLTAAVQEGLKEIEPLVADKGNPILQAEARLEKGRLQTLLAQQKVKDLKGKATPAALADAIKLFDTAAATFGETREQLKKMLDGAKKDDRPRVLTAYLNTLLSLGAMQMAKAKVEGLDAKASGQAQEAGAKALEEVATLGTKEKHELGWVGFAQQVEAWQGIDESKAQKAFREVMAAKGPEAQKAKRTIQYYQITKGWSPTPQPINPKAMAEQWLKDYPTAVNTREGQHLRLMLGFFFAEEFGKVKQDQRQAPAARELMDRANKLFEGLIANGGEYAELARRGRFSVIRLSGVAKAKKIEELRNTEECLQRTVYAMEDYAAAAKKLGEALNAAAEEPDDKQKAEEAQAARKEVEDAYHDALKACRRAIALMPDAQREAKGQPWKQAYRFLYDVYTTGNDLPRAVVVMDYLSQNAPRPEDAQAYTGQALFLYQRLVALNGDPVAKARMINLAEVVAQKYPKDPVADIARDVLGKQLLFQKDPPDYKAAAALLEQITPESPRHALASYLAGYANWMLHVASLQAAGGKPKPVTTETPERKKAVELLTRAAKAFDTLKEPDVKDAVICRFLLADIHSRLGNHAETLQALEPVIKLIQENQLPQELVVKGTDNKVLALALRTYISQGEKGQEGAGKIIAALEKRGAAEGAGAAAFATEMQQIGVALRASIAALEQDEGKRKEAEETKENFKKFLDTMAKNKAVTPEMRVWLGNSYAGLGHHLVAAETFAQVPRDAKAETVNQAVLLRITALRLAAKAAEDPAERKKLFAEAEKEIKEAMKDKTRQKNPSFFKEDTLLMQDQEQYAPAIKRWSDFTKALEPRLQDRDQAKRVQDLYYDASYNLVVCMYGEYSLLKKSKDAKAAANAKDALIRTAQKVALLKQNNYGDSAAVKARFEQFLDEHKDLKTEVTNLTKKS